MSDRTHPRNAFDPGWDGPNPATCDDVVWHETTGMCGGCGNDDCHEGPCGDVAVTDPFYGYGKSVCDKCPDRRSQGWRFA